jgi:hypothetical protein
MQPRLRIQQPVCTSVVSFGDAWEVLEAAEEALDQVSLAPGAVVEGMVLSAGGVVRDHRHGAAGEEDAADAVAVIGSIGAAEPG